MNNKLNLWIGCVWLAGIAHVFSQPSIILQPQNQTNLLGSTATFTVEAEGTPPISYQWRAYQNPVVFTNIPGATGPSLVLTNVQPTFFQFRVEVSDAEGSVLSDLARLSILFPPNFTGQLTNRVADAGSTVEFAASASGTEPLGYQWRFNGNDLPNQTGATLTLTNVSLAEAGRYSVLVTNQYGSALSQTALLTLFEKITSGPVATDVANTWGVAWGDYDNDGFIDLFLATGWPTYQTNYLYRNQGDGTFARMTSQEVGSIAKDRNKSGTCAWGDYDNDGYLDLIVGSWEGEGEFPNLLYHNNQDGTFTRALASGPIATDTKYTWGVCWGDYDNDGFLDLFSSDARNGRYTPPGGAFQDRNSLYRNNGDGTFSPNPDSGLSSQLVDAEGAGWSDYDNDGDLDLVVGSGNTNTFLWENQGLGVFNSITNFGFPNVPGAGPAWGDYDNDGLLDLFLAPLGSEGILTRLFHNDGEGAFTETIMDTTGNAGAWGDYDNDGDLDLFVSIFSGSANNILYQNLGDGSFNRVSGVSLTSDGGLSEGPCAWGDYDNNGFLDLVVANVNNTPCFLYRNVGNGNSWIIIKLVGTASNRAAIGAKVRLRAMIDGEYSWQLREISGGGHGQNDLRAHFGLGDATQVDTVRIEWPSGIVQELRGVNARQILTVTEAPLLQMFSPGSIVLQGGKGWVYDIEGSTNLTQWSHLATVTNETGMVEYADPEWSSLPWRFYRAVVSSEQTTLP